MSSLIGISAERTRVSHRARSLGAALVLTLLLAALVGFVGFDTLDATGTTRVRSAVFVWQFVPDGLQRMGATRTMVALYAAALIVTVAGAFLLIWCAALVESNPAGEQLLLPAQPYRAPRPIVPRTTSFTRLEARFCIAAMVALAVFAAWRMGLFLPLRVWGVPDTFASFDHAFHIARAETLVKSLRNGHLLRWVASHQGGYPAEFYPFGFAWLEAALWALAAGTLPMPIVHRVAVTLLFLAPGALFYAMTRRDGWPPVVAVAAFALHVAVPGDMWSGGYGELVLVGLVANVSAALAVVIAMVAASDAFASGGRRAVAIAGAAAAAAIWCNPRSAVAVVVCTAAAWAVAGWGRSWRRPTMCLVAIATIAALLAAPEVLSLIRFRELYYFVHYTSYGSPLDYVAASIDAVSLPGFLLTIVGVLTARAVSPRHLVTRTVAVALIAYSVATLIFSFGAASAIQQLETTRLMPVQRLLMIYAAAVGLHALALAAAERWRAPFNVTVAVQVGAVAALLVAYIGPPSLMPFWSRGLYPVQRSAVPEMAIFQQVLKVAETEAPPGTAILIVGSALAGHQQLWAPVRSDRLFFYDEWMWYWHRRHRGPYDPERSSKYDPDRLDEVFARAYLDHHAIGAVVVAQAAQPTADRAPALRRVFGGTFGVYAVPNATPMVTLAGRAPDTLLVANEAIRADGTTTGGDAVIRRNWFPRWRAQVNGRRVPIVETDDGYMQVAVPAGRVDVALTYALDRIDVGARLAGLAGVAALGVLLWPQPSKY